MSVPQIEEVFMRTRTSPGPGSAVGNSLISAFRSPVNTTPFTVSSSRENLGPEPGTARLPLDSHPTDPVEEAALQARPGSGPPDLLPEPVAAAYAGTIGCVVR